MSTQEVEKDQREAAAATGELIDCGRVTERTRGYPPAILIELGLPPYIGLIF